MRNQLLRDHLGSVLRVVRMEQKKTLREVALSASISLGYLSEIERGCKEVSSEMLESICEALQVPLWQVLMMTARDASVIKPTPINVLSRSLAQAV